MGFGDRALAGIGAADGRWDQLGERGKLLAGVGVVHALPRPEQRLLGGEQQLHRAFDRVGIGCGAHDGHGLMVELALILGFEHVVGHFEEHGTGLAAAHRVIGAAQKIGKLVDMMGERRPFGDRPEDVGGAEGRLLIVAVGREARRDDQYRDVLRERLGDAGKGILDARPVLSGEDTVLPSLADAREAVGHADADALLPAEDGADVDLGAGVDQRVARIAGEEFGALALQDFGNELCTVHWAGSGTAMRTRSFIVSTKGAPLGAS